jgi:hypothetical protein
MKMLSITISLLLLCSVASAQSLASVAKKEKERREANRKAGVKAVTVSQTEAGIEDSSEVTSETLETTETPASPPAEAPDKKESSPALKGEATQSDPWDAIYIEYLARYRGAANEIDQLKAEQKEICKDSDPSAIGVVMAPEGGTILNVPTEQQNRCATIPGRIARLEIELKQIKRDCAEDARRRGVVPGRARLYR